MTIEEKARAYDEALDRMKYVVIVPKDEKALQALKETIFPELRESEDERIRGRLIQMVSAIAGGWPFEAYGITKKEAITYLEKQKEHSMSAEEVLTRAGLKPYKDGNQWCILAGDNIQEGICGFGDTIDEALYQFLMEVLEKQKEQKPIQTENEREYVKTLKGLISYFIRNSGGGIVDTAYYQQIYDWLDGRHIEQKPLEKQDYSGLTDLERAIHRGFLVAGVENVPVTIIKETARECLALKPVEWLEEDEIYLQDALWCVEQATKVARDENDMGACWSAERWLKSLRPSWKPSEEQLNVLYRAAEHFQENHFVCTPLLTLYEQLKKL